MVLDLLDGAVVAITGAASGIGRATALRAAQSGASGLVLADLSSTGLDDVTRELGSYGVPTVTFSGDLTEDDVPDALVRAAVDSFGRLDAAVNSAGVLGSPADVVSLTDETIDLVLGVNLRAVLRCMRAELRQMYQQGSGAVVNVSSASIHGMHTQLAPYIATKAAVVAASRVAAKEAGRHGVRVNSICPGITETPMSDGSVEVRPETAALHAQIPLGRLGRPQEIADAILWLCSRQSSFTNGAALVVDGGRSG